MPQLIHSIVQQLYSLHPIHGRSAYCKSSFEFAEIDGSKKISIDYWLAFDFVVAGA